MASTNVSNWPPDHAQLGDLRLYLSSREEHVSHLAVRASVLQSELKACELEKSRAEDDIAEIKQLLNPIRRVPNDILRQIFLTSIQRAHSHFYEPATSLDRRGPPWTLTGVCSNWRTVVISDPLLWSTMSVVIPPRVHPPHVEHCNDACRRCVQSLIMQLSRTEKNMLDVSITVSYGYPGGCSKASTILTAMLISTAARWKTLTLRLSSPLPRRDLLWSSIKLSLTSLTRLWLCSQSERATEYEDLFTEAVKLEFLHIEGTGRDFSIPPQSLRVLEHHSARGMTLTLNNLSHFSNLEILSLIIFEHTNIGEAITFPKLQRLSISGKNIQSFLGKLSLPSLASLHAQGDSISTASIWHMQKRSEARKLIELSFHTDCLVDAEIVRLLGKNEGLQHVCIQETITTGPSGVLPLLELRLCSETFLPHLKSFKLQTRQPNRLSQDRVLRYRPDIQL